MQVHELIRKMIADETWLPLCAISDDASNKNIQYSIYELVCEKEPSRSYGYRVRISDFIAANGLKIRGG
ncbi:MAG: hypothetical protein KBS40_03185 [Bacteroidales bacterium]|nr:hypothetical protein [Bacteroidales bacterium]